MHRAQSAPVALVSFRFFTQLASFKPLGFLFLSFLLFKLLPNRRKMSSITSGPPAGTPQHIESLCLAITNAARDFRAKDVAHKFLEWFHLHFKLRNGQWDMWSWHLTYSQVFLSNLVEKKQLILIGGTLLNSFQSWLQSQLNHILEEVRNNSELDDWQLVRLSLRHISFESVFLCLTFCMLILQTRLFDEIRIIMVIMVSFVKKMCKPMLTMKSFGNRPRRFLYVGESSSGVRKLFVSVN